MATIGKGDAGARAAASNTGDGGTGGTAAACLPQTLLLAELRASTYSLLHALEAAILHAHLSTCQTASSELGSLQQVTYWQQPGSQLS
jgi:hypothetical protein